MVAKKQRGIDWLAAAQRVVVLARGIRGDSAESIHADHERELERSLKVQDLCRKVADSFDGGDHWKPKPPPAAAQRKRKA